MRFLLGLVLVICAHTAAAQTTRFRLEPVQIRTQHEIPDDPGTMTVEFDTVEHRTDLGLLVIRGRQIVQMPDGASPSYSFGSGAFEATFVRPPPPPPGSGNEAVLAIPGYTASGRTGYDDGTFLIALPLGAEYVAEHTSALAISFHHRAAASLGYRVVVE